MIREKILSKMGASTSSQVSPVELPIEFPNETWCQIIMGLSTPADIMNFIRANPKQRDLVFDCVQQINRDPS